MNEDYQLSISAPLRLLILHCNDRCRPDCCHSGAFTIDDLSVKNWFASQQSDHSGEITQEISMIVNKLQALEGSVRFIARDLESRWEVDEAIQFFTELEEVVFNVLHDLHE